LTVPLAKREAPPTFLLSAIAGAQSELPSALRPHVTVEKGTSLDGFRAKPNAPNQSSRDLRSPSGFWRLGASYAAPVSWPGVVR
jgi:hypothetical protein